MSVEEMRRALSSGFDDLMSKAERLREELRAEKRVAEGDVLAEVTVRSRLEKAIEYLEDPTILSGPNEVLAILRGEE